MTRDRVTIAIRATEPTLRAAIVDRARRRGFSRFHDAHAEPLRPDPGEEVVLRRGDRLYLTGAPEPGLPVVTVGDESALDAATRGAPDQGVLVIEWTGDRVIPLENAIASRGRRYALWVYARGPLEVPGALGALEHGADRVFVEVRSPEEVDLLESIVEGPLPSHLDWARVPVRASRPVGVGDRVIVDTTSLLRPAEGLLVGSAAAFLFHIASEAVGSQFSRPRPFRVNAGAAHSYVLMADGSTRYLSELGAGDAVLVAEPTGSNRSVRVGRIKIERRPFVVVHADDAGTDRTVFLQEAETVRLSTESGRIATTDLRAGAVVHGVKLPPARHLGRAIEETIEER
ncbi:MAG TPA: 3-dehydroquinate synthase II [Thermoplasmata archaeon]|nr:3-dehydroquinate synthase II [Thermoplasmata archaeon]